ncbi:hypothetical protein [Streptomyces glaucescens]|uniref:hypothetical protein n=1 Tax=Streptomyces glaucescens TaxID=1907 RepID=UPI001180BD16|nr:hypothetical protein [Streptomyces glaucescens]
MSNKAKMTIFLSLVVVATAIAMIQGIAAEGSKKTVPLILAALGVASLIMWTIGVRGKARKR